VNRRRGGCLVEKKSSRRTSEDSDAAAIGVKIGLEIEEEPPSKVLEVVTVGVFGCSGGRAADVVEEKELL